MTFYLKIVADISCQLNQKGDRLYAESITLHLDHFSLVSFRKGLWDHKGYPVKLSALISIPSHDQLQYLA